MYQKELSDHFSKHHWAYRNKDFLVSLCHMTPQERESVINVMTNKNSEDPVKHKEHETYEPIERNTNAQSDDLDKKCNKTTNKNTPIPHLSNIKEELIEKESEVEINKSRKKSGSVVAAPIPKPQLKVIKTEKDEISSDLNVQIAKFVASMKNDSKAGKNKRKRMDDDAKKKVEIKNSMDKIVALKSYGFSGMTIWKCTVCDRESADKKRLQTHIENSHKE